MRSRLRLRGAIAGVVSGLVALGLAELVAGFSASLRSPVLDVGDRVIDLVPSPIKEMAIDLFDTNDKLALLIGIGVVLLTYSAAVGIVAVRRLSLGLAGIGLFGVLGAVAGGFGTAGTVGALPSVVGAIAGAFALTLLVRWANAPDADQPAERGLSPHSAASRRAFLFGSSSFLVAAAVMGGVGRLLDSRFQVGASRDTLRLPVPPQPLAAPPPATALDVAGLSPFFTPNESFYRIDTALTVPQVATEGYILAVTGMVERPLQLTFDEILQRPLVESDITMTCVSNEVGGGLVGNARWLGIRLDDLLAEAGVDPAADQIVGRSVDGYTCGFPVAALDGRDALVAVGMNGEPLPLEHGFPVRLIVPGLYGYVSATKWLTEIEVTTFAEFDHYWVDRGWAVEAPIKTQSRIDTPRPLTRIPPGETAVAGVAWAQTRGISGVEVRIDEGEWQQAELSEELNDTTWRQWMLAWDATPGRHDIAVRATDATGETQTDERVPPIPDGATGWHSIVVLVDEG
ncbi:MAG: molybdopterin-dependent oxidoreductase [Actinomycetota bacterium]|nr:molybdopterin-dependent oxidoreductase [Actinomycetota bacterium]